MAAVAGDNHRLRLAVRYAVPTLIAVIFIFPLVVMVMSSLKPSPQLLADTGSMWAFLTVGDISLNNYRDTFDRAPAGLFVLNSMIVTGVTVVLSLIVCSLAAFSFVFLSWTGRGVILSVILATLIVPFETIAIPLLLIASKLPWVGVEGLTFGWLNSYRVQIVPFIADGLTIFLFVQYFKDLPRELIEAARVEGASWRRIYVKIVMPLSGPEVATAAILRFLVLYNQYLWPLMAVQQGSYRPVMVGLRSFFQLNIAWGEVMAYPGLITVPVLAFYLVLQRAFVASITSTGVKGCYGDFAMVLALQDQWNWDSWYAHDGGRWHGYFLKADKALGDPDLRHFNVSQGHAVSDDLVNWEHLGTCLAPTKGPDFDDMTTWTGSVLQGPDGLWHLSYTGARQT